MSSDPHGKLQVLGTLKGPHYVSLSHCVNSMVIPTLVI